MADLEPTSKPGRCSRWFSCRFTDPRMVDLYGFHVGKYIPYSECLGYSVGGGFQNFDFHPIRGEVLPI